MTPRIALVATTTASEAADVLAERLRHLLGLGWDARLLCRGERWHRHAPLREAPLRAHVELRDRLDGRLRRLRPDLIHFHSGWAAWKSLRVQARLGCGVVISLRDDGRDLAVPDPQRLWEAADLLLFPSRAVLDRAVDRGWPEGRAEILEPAPGRAGPEVHAPARAHGPLRLLSVGPLVWEHGLEHAIHAVALARARGVDCTYRVVGAGDHLQAVAFARHELGLAEHVQFVMPDAAQPLADELRAADVFVDASVAAALPATALATAHALGVPFAATVRDDLPADAGVVVPRRDPRALADAIAQLAADPALRGRMGAAARRHAAEHPIRDMQLQRLERLYRRVLAQA
jgi:glycosyltransferase involved in cell wall biosynthesis